MHLASDYIHPTPRGGRCRIRIFLPEEEQDAPVVICLELPNNPGGSITNSAEVIAAEMIRSHKLPSSLVWIEHWPEESTDGGEETFGLVVFSSYEGTQRALYLGREGMAGRRDLEAAGPRYRGGVGGREGIVRAVQSDRWVFFCRNPPLRAAERVRTSAVAACRQV